MRATVARDSPVSRAIFQKGCRFRFDLHDLLGCDPRAQAVRPACPVWEASGAFAFVAPEPFLDGRRRNAYSAGYGARRFARLQPCENKTSHVRRRAFL
jgi:hypothetical protein